MVSRDTGRAVRAADRRERRADHRAHADYTGGVYGSMLAASVVVGASSLGSFPRAELVLLLLLTSLVFWLAHVHAELFGARLARHPPDRGAIRRVCRDEWPIVKAAVPPAAAVAVSPLLSLNVQGALWLALSVAVAGQVGWSVAAAHRAGASRSLVLTTASVNALLGLLIVVVKIAVTH
ncbi:hypothetical protein [Streptomyces sp. NPDC048188]|uniref:hypothetical protein n=1 Tax=Streptomyces sp. NPDC048188 TaxID=3155749 RepID=UPI003447DCFB